MIKFFNDLMSKFNASLNFPEPEKFEAKIKTLTLFSNLIMNLLESLNK